MHTTFADVQKTFYEAIEQHDMALMKTVWENTPDAVYVDPAGNAYVGYDAIINSWETAFSNGPLVKFTIKNVTELVDEPIATETVVEEVLLTESGKSTVLTSTNSYRKSAKGWAMVLHQATRLSDPS